jgi:cyclophilin family peptidyl-prolyl cis-trans isomerase
LVLAAAAGCNRSGGGSPSTAAAIDGSASTTTTAGGNDRASPAKPASDPRHPVVCIETSLGNITVRLDAEKAPLTVDNFLTYVGAAFYDQTIFHQIYKGQGILAGGYDARGVEKPARTPIRNEAQNGLKNRRGFIAMVRQPDAIDSATCVFFINVADNPELDYRDHTPAGYGYCVFGEVTEGMDVVDKINAVPVHDTHDTPGLEQTPIQPVIVKSIRQIR